MAKDPVCGMTVDEKVAEKAGLTSLQQGQTFYFCSPGCKRSFEQNPQRYLGQQVKE